MGDVAGSLGSGRPGGPGSEDPGLGLRVDQLFAGAIEQQLSEQRALTDALARIDSTLEQLREQLAGDGATAAGGAVPGTLQERLEEMQSALLGALAVRDDVDRLGTAGMLRRLEELRAELNERLSSHDADATAAVEAAVAALREEAAQVEQIRTALSTQATEAVTRLGELVESTATAQREVLSTLEGATSRIESVQHDTRDRLSEVLAATLSDLQTASAEAAQAQADQLDKALDAVRRAAEQAGTDLPDKVDVAMRSRIDDISQAAAAELQTLADSAAGVMAALQETTSSVGTGFNRRIDEAGKGIAEAVRDVREALVATAAEDRELMRDGLKELQASGRQLVGDLRSSVEQADAARAASTADLSTVTKSVRALQSEVEALASRLGESVAEHEAATRDATSRFGDRVESLLETIQTSTASELGGVQRAVMTLREELAVETHSSTAALESVIERLEHAATHHSKAADTAASEALDRTRNLEETAGALGRVAKSLEPALADTAGEVLSALRQTAKDDRAQMRDGIARIQQSAERMGESLQSTMVRHIDAIHTASTAELAGVNQSLVAARRALEDATAALVDRVSTQASESGAATGAQVAELQVSLDDLRSLLERVLTDPRPGGEPQRETLAPEAARDVDEERPREPEIPWDPEIPRDPDVADVADVADDDAALAATLAMVGGGLPVEDDDEDE